MNQLDDLHQRVEGKDSKLQDVPGFVLSQLEIKICIQRLRNDHFTIDGFVKCKEGLPFQTRLIIILDMADASHFL